MPGEGQELVVVLELEQEAQQQLVELASHLLMETQTENRI